MIVGDKSVFAIEWEHRNTDKLGIFAEMYFRWWAMNQEIGEYELGAYVLSTIRETYVLNSKQGNREFCFDETTDASFVFELLVESFQDPDRGNKVIFEINKDNLDKRGESFRPLKSSFFDSFGEDYHISDLALHSFVDSTQIVLVENRKSKSQRLIWKNFKDRILREAQYDIGHIEKVASEFLFLSRDEYQHLLCREIDRQHEKTERDPKYSA